MNKIKYAQMYEETCPKCGEVHKIHSQRDDEPEYYTAVGVLCRCGQIVEFLLPVN